jgi:ATP-dependent RNA helicase DHX36
VLGQVFLPGMDEICVVQEEIEKQALLDVSVHVLHSQVSQEDQDLAVAPAPPDCCKIVLATNIAESGITVPDVEAVIDSGLLRGCFYDDHRKMQCLLSKWCSQASLKQRAGRAGRVREGTVIHLMTQTFHDRLNPFDEAEILRMVCIPPCDDLQKSSASSLLSLWCCFFLCESICAPPLFGPVPLVGA